MAQLLWMPLFAISQDTCSSGTYSNNLGDPGNERLGNDATALLHFQVATTATTMETFAAAGTCVSQLNTGDCSAVQSCSCRPAPVGSNQTIGDFSANGGILSCSGFQSCRAGNNAIDDFFVMSTPVPLECTARQTCELGFNVENVGSMCVTDSNSVNSGAGTFIFADADPIIGRGNDVCCSRAFGANQPSCKLATFLNAGSFYCSGDGSCEQLQVTLTGDLYCRSKEGCGNQLGGGSGGNNADEYWRWITGGHHCIRCESTESGLDQGSCLKADFQFPVGGSTVTLWCNGFNACQDVLLTLSSNSCANIRCDEGTAGDKDACQKMEVDLNGGQCYAFGTAIQLPGPGIQNKDLNFPIPKGANGALQNIDPVCTRSTPCPNVPIECTPSVCCNSNLTDPTNVDCSGCKGQTSTSSSTSSSTASSTTAETRSTQTPPPDVSSTTTTSGGASGDPHIHSLYGAHYTLMREGVFLAWEFKKDLGSSGKPENAVHLKLLARYGGPKFKTLGILLMDNSGHKLEFSAHDCALRAKEGDQPWYIAKAGLLLADTASSIQVQDTWRNTTWHKRYKNMIDARINFNITDGSRGSREVASLYTHCIVGDHLNFKLTMLQKKDLASVGGEMAVQPQAMTAASHVSFLSHSASSKLRAISTRTDEEFQAKKPWVDLGGTAASERFFDTLPHVSFVTVPSDCSGASEEEAEQICSKHLPHEASTGSEVFSDCVFDVCHGGGELDAELRADLMAA